MTISFGISVTVRVHDLAGSNASHQVAKWRALWTVLIYFADLVRVRHQSRLVQAFSVLVDGHVLQVGHIETLAEHEQPVASNSVVVLALSTRHIAHVVELALIEPLDKQLEALGVVLGQLQLVPGLVLGGVVGLQFGGEVVRVVGQQVAMDRPLTFAVTGTDHYFDKRSGEEPGALILSMGLHAQTVRIDAVGQGGPWPWRGIIAAGLGRKVAVGQRWSKDILCVGVCWRIGDVAGGGHGAQAAALRTRVGEVADEDDAGALGPVHATGLKAQTRCETWAARTWRRRRMALQCATRTAACEAGKRADGSGVVGWGPCRCDRRTGHRSVAVASARDASPVTLHKSIRAVQRSSHRPMVPPELPDFPSSFDPALFLHSEVPDLPSSSHTDELEALHLQTRETTEAKTRQGIVIQHRAWRVPDVFRTDEDHEPETPIKKQQPLQHIPFSIAATSSPRAPPSSPPLSAMPFLSSSPSYPQSSGPVDSPRKRRRTDGYSGAFYDESAEKENVGVDRLFQDDSDSDDDFAAFEAAHNKRKVSALDAPGSASTEQALRNILSEDASTETDLPLSQPIVVSRTREKSMFTVRTCSGEGFNVATRRPTPAVSYEQLIASRSNAEPGRARKNYYGIDIHALMDEASRAVVEDKARRENMDLDGPVQTVEDPSGGRNRKRSLLWTEKYRARKFTDLVGDERTHRLVLKWLKAWDPIVFPGSSRPRQKSARFSDQVGTENEYAHRKILLLTGPPGLGKTTLAHVCARQAGYEVQEINASDERSKDIVRGRIKDMVGTENVRGIDAQTVTGAKVRKAGKPVCVVVDEVDGVVGGGAGGEGGFIKALIDLVNLDQKNSGPKENAPSHGTRKKVDKFRLLRPLILICNDVYHPSLRPLRQASIAEIIHIRKPPVNMVVPRLHSIFEKEGIPADSDGVRRLCEATWGISSRRDGGGGGTGEGDVRGVMVVGEWVARKLLAETNGDGRLTRKWIEDNVLNDLSQGEGAARGLGRGGAKEIVERVFKEGAGFPKSAAAAQAEATNIESTRPIGVAEATKRFAMDRLREMVNTAGDTDRIVTDCFTTYAEQPFQDDTFLSKPNSAYEWLHFHDSISHSVHTGQEWELAKYLSLPVLAFHGLFASSIRPSLGNTSTFRKGRGAAENAMEPEAEPTPFSGPSAPYRASEQMRANLASLTSLQSSLSLPLARLYRSPAEVSTELIPYALRMLSPDVKPVIINTSTAATGADRSKPSATASVRKASEKALVMRAVNAMAAVGVRFEKSRVDFGLDARQTGHGGWIFRMEPPLDALGRYETMSSEGGKDEKVRYAVRQIMDVEFRKESLRLEAEARKRRGGAMELDAGTLGEEVDVREVAAAAEEKIVVKKDFFGRTITEAVPLTPVEKEKRRKAREEKSADEDVWVSFHEGFSKAVRKPITLSELLGGL